MKSDITIPKVENVFLAAVQEWSDDFMEKVWYVYLINDPDFDWLPSSKFNELSDDLQQTANILAKLNYIDTKDYKNAD